MSLYVFPSFCCRYVIKYKLLSGCLENFQVNFHREINILLNKQKADLGDCGPLHNNKKVPHLKKMAGVKANSSCTKCWRVSLSFALSWWNTTRLLLINSGSVCLGESCSLSSWWQYIPEVIVVFFDRSSKKQVSLKSHQADTIIFIWWILTFEMLWAGSFFYSRIPCVWHCYRNPLFVASDVAPQIWIILLTFQKQIADVNVTTHVFFNENMKKPYVVVWV